MDTVEKLSVTVPSDMAQLIRDKVEDGSYKSADDVVRAALRAFSREEDDHAERIASIKARIKASVEDTRPAVSLDEAFRRVNRHISDLATERDDPAPPGSA